MQKYIYELTYMVRFTLIGFILFFLWDFIFHDTLSYLENLLQAIFFAVLFAVMDFSRVGDELKATSFNIEKARDMLTIEPSIEINAVDIESCLQSLRKHYKPGKIKVVDNPPTLSVKSWPAIFTAWDHFLFRKVNDGTHIQVRTELTRNRLFADSRRLIELSRIKELLDNNS